MHTHKTNSRHDANKRETMCGRLVQGISKDTSRSGHPHVILLRVRAPQFRTEMFCKKHLLYAEGLSGERRSAGSRKARPIFMRHTKMYPSCLSFRQGCVSAFQILYAYIGAAFIIKYTCSADRANSTASGGAMSGEGLAATHKMYRSYIPFMTFLPS